MKLSFSIRFISKLHLTIQEITRQFGTTDCCCCMFIHPLLRATLQPCSEAFPTDPNSSNFSAITSDIAAIAVFITSNKSGLSG